MQTVLGLLLGLTAIFLIMVVLVQRGRGGGLAGALGGMGGQSAFGAKAGDVFTRVTIGVATFWILLCVISVKWVGGVTDDPLDLGDPVGGGPTPTVTAPLEGGDGSAGQETGSAASDGPDFPAGTAPSDEPSGDAEGEGGETGAAGDAG